MILGIHHPAVSVPDLDKALEFYCDVLGFEKCQRGPIEPSEYAVEVTQLEGVTADGWLLKAGYGYLEVWEFTQPRGEEQDFWRPVNKHGYTHIGLAVDALWVEYERLKEHMTFHREPVMHSVEGPENEAWTTYGRDPFGNVIELWQLGPLDPPLFAPEAG